MTSCHHVEYDDDGNASAHTNANANVNANVIGDANVIDLEWWFG